VFQGGQLRLQHLHDDSFRQAAALDGERLEVLVRDRPERELVAAPDAKLFQLRKGRQQRRQVSGVDPGDLALVEGDVA